MAKRGNGTAKSSQYFTAEDVLKHNTENDCWVTESGIVYDVTSFLRKHPGGADFILSNAGRDVTDILDDENTHIHTSSAYNLLRDYKIGKLVGNNNHHDKSHQEQINEQEFSMEGYKEELLDWNHGLVLQVHKLGTDYMKWVNSPVNRQLRLFDSDFVEFFSKTPWFVVPLIWIPVAIICSIVSVKEIYNTSKNSSVEEYDTTFHLQAYALLTGVAFMLLGIPVWTLVEYVLHRHLFHLEPKNGSPFWITLHFFLHGQHHKVPFDGNRLVFPPVAAAVFALIFSVLMTSLLPGGYGLAMFSGGLLGYVSYDLLHYYFHHGSPQRGSYLHSMKYYHVLHHFDDHSTGYGISTKFWDYPFNTVNKKIA